MPLGLEGGRHVPALGGGPVAVLIVGRVTHLVVEVVMRVEAAAITAALREISSVVATGAFALDRVIRFAAEVSSRLLGAHRIRVGGPGTLPHVAL